MLLDRRHAISGGTSRRWGGKRCVERRHTDCPDMCAFSQLLAREEHRLIHGRATGQFAVQHAREGSRIVVTDAELHAKGIRHRPLHEGGG